MNKLFLLLFAVTLIICNLSFAQITITNSSMPAANDTIGYSNVSPAAAVNYDTTGANITWDFSNVTPISQGLDEYKNATAVNISYGLFFGFTSYGLKVFDSLSFGAFGLFNGYDFYHNSSTVFKAVGRGVEFQGFPIPSFYSDDDEIYQFPLQFGDNDSSTFRVTFQLSTFISLSQSGSRVNNVEGWGTVITPYGTFNALKVNTTIYETDSLTFNSIPLPPISRVSREYKWLANTDKIPVFEVDGGVIGNNFFVNNIRYRDVYNPTGISSAEMKNEITVSPNPASDYLKINSTELLRSIELVDITGKIVCEGKATTMDVKSFENGMYLLRVTAKNNQRYSIPVVIHR